MDVNSILHKSPYVAIMITGPQAVGSKSKMEVNAMFGRRLKNLMIVLAVLLATCVACGGDGGKEATSPPTAQPATAEPATSQPATAQPATARPTPTAQPTVAPKESAAPTGAATLALSKTVLAPNEEFQVQFTAPDPLPEDAWVGIIPSGVPHGEEAVNDENDIDYQYLEGQTSGVLTFTAPQEPGSYDLRMNDSDSGGKEVASATFSVALSAGDVQPALVLDKTTFAPNEEFQVYITVPSQYPAEAWVGIIPSEVPHGEEAVNDENDIDYQYIDRQISGTLTFVAPQTPGSYDLRLNDGTGLETASVTFSVVIPSGDVEPSLRLDKTTFAPGEEIRVTFTAPSWYPAGAWVGLIPSDVPHGDAAVNDENDIEYEYLDGQTSGVLIFTAPDEPGSYDLRMNDSDQDGKETASVTFEVK